MYSDTGGSVSSTCERWNYGGAMNKIMGNPVPEFQEIYTTFFLKVQRFLMRMVGEAEAEDLTQEVFVKVGRALPAYRGESKLSTWIYRIATNTALDRLRSPDHKRWERNESLDSTGMEEIESGCGKTTGSAGFDSIEQQIHYVERQSCYQEFIENLPENYRTIVALSELEGLVAGEIADILGLSVETVKMRLHRGRSRLLRELKNHCNPEDWL